MSETPTKKKKKNYYVSGMRPATGRMFMKFHFQDVYVKLVHDTDEGKFHVFLKKPTDEQEYNELVDDIQFWVDYWGSNWTFTWSAETDEEDNNE